MLILKMTRLKHKRGRKSNYVKSLDNAIHKEAKSRALLRDNYKCKLCPSKLYLEYHHINYDIQGKELENDNLRWTATLCADCHDAVHKDLNHPWNPKNKHKKDIYGTN